MKDFNNWKEKPYYICGGEPEILSLEIDFEDILNKRFF